MVQHINKPVFTFESATEVRKEWSLFFDKAVREKPDFIKRTRDNAVLVDLRFMDILLEEYKFECKKYIEKDGTITLSADVLDLVENGDTVEKAREKMAASILEYAQEFYGEYDLWSNASNRKNHIPYVFKALLLNDVSKIGDCIVCQDGEN